MLLGIASASAFPSPKLRGIDTVSVWPDIPAPNGTVEFAVKATNVSYVHIQLCINGLCFTAENMTYQGNDTYRYLFVPGNGHYPATVNGTQIDYHILTDVEEYNGTLIVQENNPPRFGEVIIDNPQPHLGDNITVEVNVTDDFSVHNVTCYFETSGGVLSYPMVGNGSTYTLTTKLLYEGSYFAKIVAYDNSNQSNFTTARFFVYPSVQEDHEPPQLIDAYGVQNGTRMKLVAYITDKSGVMEAKALVLGKWYALKEVKEGMFEASTPVSSNVTIYAKDPYNNTLNTTVRITVFNEEKEKVEAGTWANPFLLIGLGALIALVIFLPFKKTHIFVILIAVFAVVASIAASLPEIASNAGGNVFNGNTCWSCLGLQPHSSPKGWLVDYPDGKPVNHPAWIREMLKNGPVFIYVHQVPCTGCEVQWKDMIKGGIITPDGNLTSEYRGKISFVILDATYGSPTRDRALEVLKTYSLGVQGTPTTVVLTEKNGEVYWYSKSGVVYAEELKKVLNEAIEMYGE